MPFCSGCGSQLAVDSRFCPACGRPAGDPAAPGAPHTTGHTAYAHVPGSPPSAARRAAIVFGVCAGVSMIGWSLFAIPARIPTAIIRRVLPSQVGCTATDTQSLAMYLCSAKVAALLLIGPILVTFLIFTYRARLAATVRAITPKLPLNARFLVAPVVATIAFALAWAGSHFEVGGGWGIVPQRVFPAFIGLFTFATVEWGPTLQDRFRTFFDFRDRFPLWLRVAAALLVPVVIAFVITYQERVTEPILKEQFIVLLSIATGYLALAPRTGSLAGVLKQ